ncbi:MAG: 4-hydroxy-tetrahydrodipicolinate synthase [Candidatus Paracaedibacteraceae bacterium]|nr:4-hydroxy-tetrahydrodipicolinate synthase [Candidatus Paracaedibacteraceae bacterium]
MLKGSIVALITPFRSNIIDVEALKQLLEWHISAGTNGIVVCGTTGEAAMLTTEERNLIISIAVSVLKGKVPVIVGCGTASTMQTLAFMQEAEILGADATLVVAPYYVKPSQEGIIQHFKLLHDNTRLPIIVYNNPGRVGVNIEIETVIRLCALPRVLGFKDSHNDATRMVALRQQVGHGMSLFSGEDTVVAAHMLYGADGAISVLGNVVPELFKCMMDAWTLNDIQTFTHITHVLYPLCTALCLESNPCTIKYAVSKLGYCTADVRLPLMGIREETKQRIDAAFAKLHK